MKTKNILLRSAAVALALATVPTAALADRGYRSGRSYYRPPPPPPVVRCPPPRVSHYSRPYLPPPPPMPATHYRTNYYRGDYCPPPVRYYRPTYVPTYRTSYSRGYTNYCYPSSGVSYSWGGGYGSRSGGTVWINF